MAIVKKFSEFINESMFDFDDEVVDDEFEDVFDLTPKKKNDPGNSKRKKEAEKIMKAFHDMGYGNFVSSGVEMIPTTEVPYYKRWMEYDKEDWDPETNYEVACITFAKGFNVVVDGSHEECGRHGSARRKCHPAKIYIGDGLPHNPDHVIFMYFEEKEYKGDLEFYYSHDGATWNDDFHDDPLMIDNKVMRMMMFIMSFEIDLDDAGTERIDFYPDDPDEPGLRDFYGLEPGDTRDYLRGKGIEV